MKLAQQMPCLSGKCNPAAEPESKFTPDPPSGIVTEAIRASTLLSLVPIALPQQTLRQL